MPQGARDPFPLRRSDDAPAAVLAERLDGFEQRMSDAHLSFGRRFDSQDRTLAEILAQQKLTNGRVNAVELKEAVRAQRELDASNRGTRDERRREMRVSWHVTLIAGLCGLVSSAAGYLFLLAIGHKL